MKASNRIDMTGKTYNNWYVIEYSHTKGKITYWKCRCELCKKEYIVDGRNVRSGRSKSCVTCAREVTREANKGMRKVGDRTKYPVEETPWRYLMTRYKKDAKRRGIEFDLSFNTFKTLTTSNCNYCGIEPSKTVNTLKNHKLSEERKAQGTITYNGIDRIDSSKDYVEENVTSCCSICNTAKLNMSVQEFKEWINRIHSNINNF